MMVTVHQVLQRKARQALCRVSPETSIFSTLQVMADQNIGAVLVMEKDALLGIFSERDYARRVVLHGLTSASTPVRAVMSTQIIYVKPDDTIDTCMALMTNRHVRH